MHKLIWSYTLHIIMAYYPADKNWTFNNYQKVGDLCDMQYVPNKKSNFFYRRVDSLAPNLSTMHYWMADSVGSDQTIYLCRLIWSCPFSRWPCPVYNDMSYTKGMKHLENPSFLSMVISKRGFPLHAWKLANYFIKGQLQLLPVFFSRFKSCIQMFLVL